MKKNLKKILAVILTAALMLSMCTVMSFAAEDPTVVESELITIETLTKDILSGDFTDLFTLSSAFFDAGVESGFFDELAHSIAIRLDFLSEIFILILNSFLIFMR